MEASNQLSLLAFGQIELPSETQRVLKTKDITGKAGKVVGLSVALQGRKELAETLNLKGRDNSEALQDAELKQSDEMLKVLKGKLASLGDNWTFKKVAVRGMSDGEAQLTMVVRTVTRKKGISIEKIAQAYGIPVEKVEAFISKQQAELAKNTVDVESKPAEPAKLPETNEQP